MSILIFTDDGGDDEDVDNEGDDKGEEIELKFASGLPKGGNVTRCSVLIGCLMSVLVCRFLFRVSCLCLWRCISA